MYIGTQSGSVNIVECSDGTVYIQDPVSLYTNGTWVKGTKKGNTITVPARQPLYYSSKYNTTVSLRYGLLCADGSISAADDVADVFTFTVEDDVITLQGTQAFDSDNPIDSYYMGAFWDDDDLATGFGDAKSVWTKLSINTQVNELPYANNFDDLGQDLAFTIIDANEDGSTWYFTTSDGNGYAQYQWNDDNAGDDWLVSPAIKLETGKIYHINIDAWAESDYNPERVEVKLGSAKTAAAMTKDVIPATVVDWNSQDIQTLQSKGLTVDADGYYYFGIHAISDANKYYLNVDNFYVDVIAGDAPNAVTDLTVVPIENQVGVNVCFTAPATNINGEALDENISVNILRDGNVIKTIDNVAASSAQEFVDDATYNLTVGTHKYQVIPVNSYGQGNKSDEIEVFVTTLLTVPYAPDLTDESIINEFFVIDNNDDRSTWNYNDGVNYAYNDSNAGDDYLITMPIALKAGKNYTVVVGARAMGADYPERFEVKIGKQPTVDGLTTTIINPTDVESEDAKEYENIFSVTEDGNYYVAIHAISDPNMYRLYIDKFSVEEGAVAKGPGAPKIEAVADDQGGLSTSIKLTAPTKAYDATDLTGNLTKIEVYRDGKFVGQVEDVAPGATKSFLDNNIDKSGVYTYQAIPYNAAGNGEKSEKANVFVGLDEPNAVENLAAADNGATVLLNWDKVGRKGINGGYVNPAKVTYNVWSTKIEEGWSGKSLVLDQEIGTGVDIDNFEVNYNPNEGEQEYQYWAVETSNDATDVDNGGQMVAAPLLVGEAYSLPMEEGFAGGSFHYFWDGSFYGNSTDEASDEDGMAYRLYSLETGEYSLTSGKVNINSAANPTLIFDTKGTGITSVKIMAAKDGGDMETIKTATIGSDYSTVKVPLKALKDSKYIRFAISAEIANPTTYEYDESVYDYVNNYGDLLYVDNIRIVDLYEYDLSIDMTAPAQVTVGKNATVTAVVKNEGENVVSGYTVTITAGDKTLLEKTISDELAAFKKQTFTAELATTVFDEAADVTISAKVAYLNDQNPDNDNSEALISILEPNASAPENLTAENKGDNGVDLTWNAPSTSVEQITEDFEDTSVFEPFSLGGITATTHTGAFGDWTLYDGNGITVYGFQSIPFENAYEPAAWQVAHPAQVSATLADNYAPKSGNQFLWSFCPADEDTGNPAADHWLISPVLPGVAQTISFYARAMTAKYGAETFEVLASATDNNPDNFTVVKSESIDVTEWTEFTADLPAGTKYFAIRHTSKDIFGMIIDDITYLGRGGSVAGYNIYYDGKMIASVEGGVTTFTAENVAIGEHTFGVTATYANGAESRPAITTIMVATSIDQISIDGKPVDIYTLDGKLVRSQTTTLDGLKGIYVVNGKVVILK